MMTLHRYFKRVLPTPEETRLSERATSEANQAVANVLRESTETTASRKHSYLVFSDDQRAAIVQYAATNGNAAAVKKLRGEFKGRLDESTVSKFKKRHHEEFKPAQLTTPEGCDPEVSVHS